MIDDHDKCEWVNVSSGISSPGLSRKKARAVKQLCVCVFLKASGVNRSSSIWSFGLQIGT